MNTRIITALFGITLLIPARAQEGPLYDDRPKITVSGEAVVNVVPDKIAITFGIETSDGDILVSKQRNVNILQKAVEAMREAGIPDKNIQTDHLSIAPRYKDDYRRENFLGYFVRNSFVVTLSKPEQVETLVTKALQAGVNYIHGVDFQTTEYKKYREQAREMALLAAREKAVKMAAALGQSVGEPLQIQENPWGGYWRYNSSWSNWGWGRDSGMSQNVMQDIPGGASEISDTIALGKIAIRANVTVTFELD